MYGKTPALQKLLIWATTAYLYLVVSIVSQKHGFPRSVANQAFTRARKLS